MRTMDPTEAATWVGGDNNLRRNFVRYGVNKSNYCAPVLDVWLRRDLGGVLVPADLVKAVPSSKRKQAKVVSDDNDF